MNPSYMRITCCPCKAGYTLPLLPSGLADSIGPIGHRTDEAFLPALTVGTVLHSLDAATTGATTPSAHFRVTGRILWPTAGHAIYLPLLTALTNVSRETMWGANSYRFTRQGYALAWITLSDKGFMGQREDKSGPLIEEMLRAALPLCHAQGFLLADESHALRALLTELALGQGYDIICTTGGTGLGPRDIAPQATEAVLDIRLPGFEQAMMAASLAKTPHAALSRAVVGIVGTCLCINLPGSAKAVRENLAAILPALAHALKKLHGDTTDCGGA